MAPRTLRQHRHATGLPGVPFARLRMLRKEPGPLFSDRPLVQTLAPAKGTKVEVLTGDQLHGELRHRSIERAVQLTWQRRADQTAKYMKGS